jgi:hypothetical protein
MALDGDGVIYSHLFVAVPELLWEEKFIKYLEGRGLIDNEALAFIAALKKDKARLDRIRKRIRGKPLFSRILAVAPEILNRKLVQVLFNTGHINRTDRDMLNILLRTMGVAKGGIPTTRAEIILRARKLLGRGMVEDALQLLVGMKEITPKEANRMRALMMSGGLTIETLKKIRHAKGIAEMLAMAGSGLIDKRAIDALRISGLIDMKTANALLTAISYGKAEWTIFEGSKRAEGLAARMAYVVSGSFSWEAVDFLTAIRKLTPQQRAYLEFAVIASQGYNRFLMEQMTNRKFRVIPGEPPIVSYARASQELDDDLLKLLAQASDDARRAAERLAGTARGAEYALRANALHQAMRQVWEGTGYLTIFHERQVAEAAVSASEMLMTKYYSSMKPFAQRMMEMQARSGLDSYISRKENTLQLSRRVYGNLNVWTGKIDKQINLAILQGKSAKEIGDQVKSLINPKVMGGVRYAAMRLGRTELANSFHFTTIRHSREMPWVRGYKWNRSRSHRHSDVCDEYANDDHDGLGPGVFKKANVPGKPHPQCMCYVTIVGMTEDEFVKAYKAGRFNAYMNSRVVEKPLKDRIFEEALKKSGKVAGRVAGQVAMSQGMHALDNMLHTKGKSPSVNPTRLVRPANKKPRLWADTVEVQAATWDADEIAKWEKAEAKAIKDLPKSQRAFEKRRLKFNSYAARRSLVEGADEIDYQDILPADSGMSGFQDESFASAMYGTRAYRVMNANLRKTGGKLKAYDAEFGDLDGIMSQLHAAQVDNFIDFDDLNDIMIDADDIIRGMDDENLYHYFDSLKDRITETGLPLAIRSHSDIPRFLDNQMTRTKGDRMVYRVSGNEWFGLGRALKPEDVGMVFKDHAYTSTEGIKGYFSGTGNAEMMLDTKVRQNRVRLFLPDGTIAMRLNDFEREILLSRGGKFQIMDIIKEPEGSAFENMVDVMLLSQPKMKTHFRLLDEDEESMLDNLLGDF